ncbi:hypothetical protein CYLTODRAFT_401869 [Cylindrobasidium torrendii FP15055 ss-10]|uniref:Uncharacterized protein n=1 Tax=Cylindrobasidium torrendii FP15055 ss-10 TaxID=1314674 RepID=A0A0D7B2K6_9AGAR|nr:hypothetical protein CYLTODRAFT_401869 [Cylindrobasidium torrendii FP15055 ss-10]
MTGMLLSALVIFAVPAFVVSQKNITVNETDTTQISFSGRAGDASVCKLDSNGSYIGGQAGCYNLIPSGCSETVAMAQNAEDAGASFKFNGTAIYINSIQYAYSPLYTISLDGEDTDVDGYVNNTYFQCSEPLFSKTGLDANTEHTISLTVKGRSPQRTDDTDDGVGIWSLISFVYTPADSKASASSSAEDASSTATQGGDGASGLTLSSLSLGIIAMVVFSLTA